ncbi:putative UDP-rhamnose:rhamnosyltransferase 1 [Phoenix dactylifera]|uniref:UDP-rhamnose:rhamnosyltransferase 1 n=1 Tax=Phoenix dactylifera TaxID=42345 RepID=A0A8B7CW92_PHODC|nr:putative UDP-rhamnose:rhamnosyltransferase 1 [Phoenix dactylifera]
MAMGEQRLHIAMLPWLAFGHMIPYLHLAFALATAGHRVSFLSSPRNNRRLPKIPPHLTPLIAFVDLPLPRVDGLPEEAEATVDVPADKGPLLKIAYDFLQNPVKKFLADESPDVILHDFLPYWVPAAARDLGVLPVLLFAFNAASTGFTGPPEVLAEEGRRRRWPSPESMTSPPEWFPPGSTVAFRRREAEQFYSEVFTTNTSGIADVERFRLAVEGCTAIALRTCPEYEGEYLDVLRRIYRKPVFPVGLIPPATSPAASADRNGRWGQIFGWLDAQPPKSVVFVSFGSEYKLSESEVRELAYGLELSNVRFLWALRRPAWVTGGDEEALPKGFAARTEGRGAVCFGWAPQLEILAHPSVGGSLFHSGWGSIIETLRYGNALIVLPNIFDQGLNARLLVEKGIAVEVERGDDGSYDRDGVAKALQMVMLSNEVEGLRRKAREMAAVFADKELHDRYLKEFINFLLGARLATNH